MGVTGDGEARGRAYLELAASAPLPHGARPGWSGPATLFGAPYLPPGELPATLADVTHIAAGAPFDGTASSRPGAAEGPRAIREASVAYAEQLHSLGEDEMLDLRSGRTVFQRRPRLVDAGDLHVYPSDPARTFAAVAASVRELARRRLPLLLLGGDHSVSFPAFAGLAAALADDVPLASIGYLQIDHHFDFGLDNEIHGPLCHTSNARRVAELPGILPRQLAFVGAGGVTRRAQLADLVASGTAVVRARELESAGAAAVEPALERLAAECEAVYVSVDIDVLDAAFAPGTGNVTIGGISSATLLDLLDLVREALPIACLDVVEVAPRYDPTGRTAHVAARLLLDVLTRGRARPTAAAGEPTAAGELAT